ncbi:Hypothetical predicted protein [Paramuricea clavata]|uniref:UMOD/GP2/OIT3-like D8C domain-containing protein n=1 Tax=Paramuricea clavata TaxID=317549 RepID=A0A7D9E4N5_PARCT|nr:Hypothetical predicted protein [Paramuricea clavata]
MDFSWALFLLCCGLTIAGSARQNSLTKRLWKKCMDFQVKRDDGKLISYKLVGQSVTPVEGSCSKDVILLHSGIVVVPDSSAAQKVPAIDGLLEYRKDKQELYVRSNKTWNVLALENKVNQQLNRLEILIKKHHNFITKFNQAIPHQECLGYRWLTKRSRNQKYLRRDGNCDKSLLGWYRFSGEAGSKIATSCVPTWRCGTKASGWMNGAHPTVAQGKVTRKVCYSWRSNCCYLSNNIEVVSCGRYYVYKLGPPPTCYLGYCGSDN